MTSSERRFRHLAIVRQLKAAGERLLDATELSWVGSAAEEARRQIEGKLDRCVTKLENSGRDPFTRNEVSDWID